MNPIGNLPWTEQDSKTFIEAGAIHTPSREQIKRVILDLIPATEDEEFQAVELGSGSGWLSQAILEKFRHARILALDGSPLMLEETTRRLGQFAGRFDVRQFRLEEIEWMTDLPREPRCIVSCLVVHHLDGAGKQALYRQAFSRLTEPGGLIIADLVAPRSTRERHFLAREWDSEVRRQSLELTGSLDVYREFVDDHSNWFEHPDPADMPSTIPQHLGWLEDAGFESPHVFWMRAGHAVYGGIKEVAAPKR
jgi:SAM-dependent methyltransferase